MRQFIEECLNPSYKIHWLDTIYFDPALINKLQLYIAINDNRLLKI